jgi:hypothetical protein
MQANKLLDFVQKNILNARKKESFWADDTTILGYADYLLEHIEKLEHSDTAEKALAIMSYTVSVKRSIRSIKNYIQSGVVSKELATKMLENLADKLYDAEERFK